MVDLSEFKVSNYPDGHKHIVSTMDLKGDTRLTASIRNFDDLFLIAQVRHIHHELRRLDVKYLLAGRCDRRFSPGEALDLEIVCDFISRLGFDEVRVLKPHSAKTLECLLHGFEWDETPQLLRMCEDEIRAGNGVNEKICYVSPDAGASRWITQYNLSPVIQGSKKRDANGAVAGVEFIRYPLFKREPVNSLAEHADCQNFVIVDDLCDGGGTFIAIAKAIHEYAPNAKVYLVVTHAIFSKGFEPFEGHIERVYCTDSFATFNNPLVKQLKLS
jgi:ribose-phosphate pyrophosphokinase